MTLVRIPLVNSHVLPRLAYACWEQAPSKHTAALTFLALDPGRCGTCHHLVSRYVCSDCCGIRGVAEWSGTHATALPERQGGGVFMEGARWVCLLREVAQVMGLENSASGLRPEYIEGPPLPRPPWIPPLSPPPPSQLAAADAYAFPMPNEYNLE